MEKKYKVGVLGCASIALRSLLPAFSASVRFEVAAIASRDFQKASVTAGEYRCTAYGRYEELLDNEEIDLVYVPLPTGLHYEWIRKSLEKGKHVMSEKSLACTYEEVVKLTELARSKQLLLIENFQFRYHSQHLWVKEVLAKGELGDIRCFRSSFGFPPFQDENNIRYSKSLGGGALLDAGAYTLKAMQFILPEYSFILRSATLFQSANSEVDVYGGAHLDTPQGVIAELAFGFDNYYQCGYEIWGSLGKLTTTRAFTAPATYKPIVILEKQGACAEISLPEDDHFRNMLLHIAYCLDNNDFMNEYTQNLTQSRFLADIKEYCYGK